ncbi:unnamed protein product, partial [Prorocentrum cordatum]
MGTGEKKKGSPKKEILSRDVRARVTEPQKVDLDTAAVGSASGSSSSAALGLSVPVDLNAAPTLGQIQNMMEQMMVHMATMTNSVKTEVTKHFEDQIGDIKEQLTTNQEEIRRVASLASGAQEGVVATRFEIAKLREEK